MEDLTHLVGLLKALDDKLIKCMKCGFCQAVCPLYNETFKESDTSRGKVAILEGLAESLFNNLKIASDRVNRCVTCGSCEANCPSGVDTLDIFYHSRIILSEYNGLPLAKKIIFRNVLAKPAVFDSLLKLGSTFQNIFLKKANEVMQTSCVKYFPQLKRRHIKKLARHSFHKKYKSKLDNNGKLNILFFYGCVIDRMLTSIGDGVIKVLNHFNVNTIIPEKLICCGIPALASGDIKTFTALLKKQVKLMEGISFDYIISACATCSYTLKKLWKDYSYKLNEEERAVIIDFSNKTLDINEFLVNILKINYSKEQISDKYIVTYHDPCHLRKSLKISDEPRKIIAMSGHNFNELPESDWCCGSGGSFNLQHYDMSYNIGLRKLKNIDSVDPDIVASSCPGCILQILDLASQNNKRYKVKHVMELLAETI
jgi:glycolate oxidase iron-sulfur subunit